MPDPVDHVVYQIVLINLGLWYTRSCWSIQVSVFKYTRSCWSIQVSVFKYTRSCWSFHMSGFWYIRAAGQFIWVVSDISDTADQFIWVVSDISDTADQFRWLEMKDDFSTQAMILKIPMILLKLIRNIRKTIFPTQIP